MEGSDASFRKIFDLLRVPTVAAGATCAVGGCMIELPKGRGLPVADTAFGWEVLGKEPGNFIRVWSCVSLLLPKVITVLMGECSCFLVSEVRPVIVHDRNICLFLLFVSNPFGHLLDGTVLHVVFPLLQARFGFLLFVAGSVGFSSADAVVDNLQELPGRLGDVCGVFAPEFLDKLLDMNWALLEGVMVVSDCLVCEPF